MWELISYTEIKLPLKPYLSEYILGIVENENRERLITQIDKRFSKELKIGLKGHIKRCTGPCGEINLFAPILAMRDDEDVQEPKERRIEKIGVVGTGMLGSQIAQLAAQYGFKVILKSRSKESLLRATTKIEKNLLKYMTLDEKDNVIRNINLTTEFTKLKDADIIIECIIENEESKKQLFKELCKLCSEKTLFATNTSSLSVDDLASVIDNPQRFVGIHFFNPVDKMQLVEVVRGKATSQQTIDASMNFVGRLDKKPIIVNDSPGFIVNRVLMSYLNESVYLLEEDVASISDIDMSVRLGLNYPMGPFALIDLIGLDVFLSIMESLYRRTESPKYKPCPRLYEMVHEGRLGKKTKKGFYDY